MTTSQQDKPMSDAERKIRGCLILPFLLLVGGCLFFSFISQLGSFITRQFSTPEDPAYWENASIDEIEKVFNEEIVVDWWEHNEAEKAFASRIAEMSRWQDSSPQQREDWDRLEDLIRLAYSEGGYVPPLGLDQWSSWDRMWVDDLHYAYTTSAYDKSLDMIRQFESYDSPVTAGRMQELYEVAAALAVSEKGEDWIEELDDPRITDLELFAIYAAAYYVETSVEDGIESGAIANELARVAGHSNAAAIAFIDTDGGLADRADAAIDAFWNSAVDAALADAAAMGDDDNLWGHCMGNGFGIDLNCADAAINSYKP